MTQTVGQQESSEAPKVATPAPDGETPPVETQPPQTEPAEAESAEPAVDEPQPTEPQPTAAEPADPAAQPRPARWRPVLRWALRILPTLVPAVLMFLIAVQRFTTAVFSWDEVATADIAQRSYTQIWQLSQHIDATITPYYLFMHAWIGQFGNSEAAMRAPSLIAISLAAALTSELGRRLHSPTAGFVAGLLFCLVPNTSRYAQEARPYALACLVAVVAVLVLLRALRRPTVTIWVTYALTVILLGATHLIAITSLGAHLIITVLHLVRSGDRSNRIRVLIGYLAATAAAAGAVMPLALLSSEQMENQIGWIEPIYDSTLRAGPADIIGSATGAWLLIGLALVASTRRWRNTAAAAALTAVPVVAVAVASFNGTDIWVPRYMLIAIAPLTVLAATAVVSIADATRRTWMGLTVRLLVVVAVLGWTTWPEQEEIRTEDSRNGANYRAAAEAIAMDQQPGDVILYQVAQRNMRQGLDYYLRDVPGRPVDFLMVRSAAEAGDLRAVEAVDPVPLLNGRNRVWFFVYGRPRTVLWTRPDLQPVLRKQFRPAAMWRMSSSTLVLYERRAPLPPPR